MKKAYDNGNEIGSHTFTHARISKLSNEQIKKEMYEDERAIFGAIQKYPAGKTQKM
jgi:peptidoglycan/xylan/chitin deacetylase (PgdA/CDA1 family)